MAKWQNEARTQVFLSAYGRDAEYTPRYRVPNRRFFWEVWKPRWRWVDGISRAQLARAHGIDPAALAQIQEPPHPITFRDIFGFGL